MIVVLGGTGFIGSHTAAALAASGEEVVVTTRSGGRRNRVLAGDVSAGRVRVLELDLTHRDALTSMLRELRPDSVIDLSGHAPKELDPADDVMERATALTNVLEAVRQAGVSRLTITSSMDVYWCLPADEIPYVEDTRVVLQERGDNFITQAWAKKVLEVTVGMYARQCDVDVLTLRLGGVYGPGYSTYLSLVSRLARAAATAAPVDYDRSLGGIPVAEAGYDLSYVKDIAGGISTIHRSSERQHSIYNVGAGRAVTHGEVSATVESLVPGFVTQTRSRPDYVQRHPNAYMSMQRATDEFGLELSYTLERGVGEYLDWLRSE